MTNKINGIDVSEWELKGVLIPITECKYFEGIGDCKESKGLCVDNNNCYFKQLKRLQEEIEELKEKIKSEKYIKENALQEATKYSMKCGEFRQALEEIRNIAEDAYDNDQEYQATGVYNEIVDKINEVLNDRD